MSAPTFYRRRLPLLTPIVGQFFTTALLHGALPKPFLKKWQYEEQLESTERARRWFRFLEKGLEQDSQGSRWLTGPGVSGEFWQHEGFDRLVRTNEEGIRTLRYILNNPVQAGLVRHWREWPWSWCREDLVCHAP